MMMSDVVQFLPYTHKYDEEEEEAYWFKPYALRAWSTEILLKLR